MASWQSQAYRELATPVDRVVGSTAKALANLRVHTIGDLLRLAPRRYYTGTQYSDLAGLREGDEVAVLAQVSGVRAHTAGGPRRSRLQVQLTDGHSTLAVTFFGKPYMVEYWQKQLPVGARGIFCGKVGSFNGMPQLTHPDFVTIDDEGAITGGAERNHAMGRVARGGLIGLYPGTGKLRTWNVAECIQLAMDHVGELEDPWPAWVREEAAVVDLSQAFTGLHRPTDLQQADDGRRRLRFDEAFEVQLAMANRRLGAERATARRLETRSGRLRDALIARLPFALTAGQQQVVDEITTEIAGDHPMHRLLQGEVGSGKTVVALLAMAAAVDAGAQAVLIAPTEVLAVQHHRTIMGMLGDLGLAGTLEAGEWATGVTLLTGSLTTQQRREALLDIASGQSGLVVGTHAVLSRDVQFADLGLVVIDEQHRFGVEQRGALNDRAELHPHVLVMTATPIPRSVAMTVFGDLEVSSLTDVPAGRAEVSTTVVDTERNPSWVERAWQRAREEVAAGRQVFVVCPRVHSDGPGEGAAAVDMVEELRSGPLQGLSVDLLHGQLPAQEKDDAMHRMTSGETDVLVATTVIEVGVDVPNASMMIICDADRFGVSQLHQLRGRIGRGQHPGVCLLMSAVAPGEPARERLDAVAATRDGFRLAEVDLAQRREGDVLGSSQAGHRSSLRMLSVIEHGDLIAQARELAERALQEDPDLSTPGYADAVTRIEELANGDWLG